MYVQLLSLVYYSTDSQEHHKKLLTYKGKEEKN